MYILTNGEIYIVKEKKVTNFSPDQYFSPIFFNPTNRIEEIKGILMVGLQGHKQGHLIHFKPHRECLTDRPRPDHRNTRPAHLH